MSIGTITRVDFRTLGAVADLPDKWLRAYHLKDLRLRVTAVRISGELFAFDDLCRCGEERCPLSAGHLTGTTLMCRCHGSQWDLTSAAVLGPPATAPLRMYEVRVRGGLIEVRV